MRLSLLLTFILAYTISPAQDTISVYFDNGVSVLNIAAKHRLDSLAYHNILTPGKHYTIIGYADILGGEDANNTLSARRAKAVAGYILSFGITIDTAMGVGEVAKPEHPGGYPEDRRVDIIAGKTITLPDIKTLKKGDVFDLENMFFYGGQAVMKPESMPILESLLAIVKQNPRLKIRIEGHVHCTTGYNVRIGGRHREQYNIGNKEEYQELSTARAKIVRNYLVANRIDSTRLQYAGLACKEMNLHPENNRRVSIRILEK